MKKNRTFIKSSICCFLLLIVLTLITGTAYPLFITFSGILLFPDQARGSLQKRDNAIVGSRLLGQAFSDNRYFHSRPSATNYSALPSGGSNQTQISSALRDAVSERKKRFALINGVDSSEVPVDMIYASGSGLDPHISPEAAFLQVQRICKARGFDSSRCTSLLNLVKSRTEMPQWLIFGDSRINVLLLNLALDSLEVTNGK